MQTGLAGATMTISFKAAMVQTCTGIDLTTNIDITSRFVRQAASDGAIYIQTPEVTTLIETKGKDQFDKSQPDDDSNIALCAFRSLAAELKIWLHIGSMSVRQSHNKLANRAFLFNPDGEIIARYDKIHMFDVNVDDTNSFQESRRYDAGEQAVLAALPWGNLGITICYDMRFPHLYRALAQAGAHFLAIPSAFTIPTGQAHWHTLLRARAIENGCFVMAAAQAGDHASGRKSYGHSLIISPWGEILAEMDGLQEGFICADIEADLVQRARKRVASLNNDRNYDIVHHASIS